MFKPLRGERGFTLIEMMVVLAIIALIAVFAIPNITQALGNSRIKSVEAQARQIQNAFDSYYNDNNEYPDGGSLEDITPSTFAEVYDYFFKVSATQGVLTQYVSLPGTIGDALFIPRAFHVTNGAAETSPVYEFVIEVKNVNAADKYIHITKTGVTRNSTATGSTSNGAKKWDN